MGNIPYDLQHPEFFKQVGKNNSRCLCIMQNFHFMRFIPKNLKQTVYPIFYWKCMARGFLKKAIKLIQTLNLILTFLKLLEH